MKNKRLLSPRLSPRTQPNIPTLFSPSHSAASSKHHTGISRGRPPLRQPVVSPNRGTRHRAPGHTTHLSTSRLPPHQPSCRRPLIPFQFAAFPQSAKALNAVHSPPPSPTQLLLGSRRHIPSRKSNPLKHALSPHPHPATRRTSFGPNILAAARSASSVLNLSGRPTANLAAPRASPSWSPCRPLPRRRVSPSKLPNRGPASPLHPPGSF